MCVKVLIVDDEELIRNSTRMILQTEDDIEVLGTCKNGDEAFKYVMQEMEPDVILMDIRMPVCDGVQATKKILDLKKRIKIIILTTFSDDEYLFEALRLGAKGYLLKNVSPERLVEAIRLVNAGNLLVHQDMAFRVPCVLRREKEMPLDKFGLTDIEIQIVKMISNGLTNKDIAQKLFLGEGTIKNKTSKILGKLGLNDRTQIAVFYLKNGKIDY